MARQKLAIIPTGGTIMSVETPRGLAPGVRATELSGFVLEHAPSLFDNFAVTFIPFEQKDSTRIDSRDWIEIVRLTYRASQEGNKVLITHGTDTLAYTSSALSFALRKPSTNIVLTASMREPRHPRTDVSKNLSDAGRFLLEDTQGIHVVFHSKVMPASRITKVDSVRVNAFQTINHKNIAIIKGNDVVYRKQIVTSADVETGFFDTFDRRVYTLKITPELSPDIFDVLISKRYKGLVVEAFGSGNVPDNPTELISGGLAGKINEISPKTPVVITSQTVYGGVHLDYEAGSLIEIPPAINGRDMTPEAAHVKLMWCLGQGMNIEGIRAAFRTNYSGEITLT
jgi:L-asparaginase